MSGKKKKKPSPGQSIQALSPGDYSGKVAGLQAGLCFLIENNSRFSDLEDYVLYENWVRGTYDEELSAAVRAFQAKVGIAPSGIADEKTLSAIGEAIKTSDPQTGYKGRDPGSREVLDWRCFQDAEGPSGSSGSPVDRQVPFYPGSSSRPPKN